MNSQKPSTSTADSTTSPETRQEFCSACKKPKRSAGGSAFPANRTAIQTVPRLRLRKHRNPRRFLVYPPLLDTGLPIKPQLMMPIRKDSDADDDDDLPLAYPLSQQVGGSSDSWRGSRFTVVPVDDPREENFVDECIPGMCVGNLNQQNIAEGNDKPENVAVAAEDVAQGENPKTATVNEDDDDGGATA